MKSLLILSMAFLFTCVAGCGKDTTPDNALHGERVEADGRTREVLISPTWGQANTWAAQRSDHAVWNVLGLLLLLIFVAAVYARATDAGWWPESIRGGFGNLALVIYAALALVCLKWQSAAVRWNNDKWIPAAQVEQYKGDTRPVWDSLRSRCLIVSGPYECYK